MDKLRTFISEEFARRKSKNNRYSLRSFARALDVSPASLSQILNGKRKLTAPVAAQIASRLVPHQVSSDQLLHLLLPQPVSQMRAKKTSYVTRELELETFRFICDWYHFAILGLSHVRNNRWNVSWIARMLGITCNEAQAAMDRLRKLDLVRTKGVGFEQNSAPLRTPEDIQSHAIRAFHMQNLRHAEHALEAVDVDRRDFSAVVVAVDETNLIHLKKEIRKFRDRIEKLSKLGSRDTVYTVAVQLFPVSKNSNQLEKNK